MCECVHVLRVAGRGGGGVRVQWNALWSSNDITLILLKVAKQYTHNKQCKALSTFVFFQSSLPLPHFPLFLIGDPCTDTQHTFLLTHAQSIGKQIGRDGKKEDEIGHGGYLISLQILKWSKWNRASFSPATQAKTHSHHRTVAVVIIILNIFPTQLVDLCLSILSLPCIHNFLTDSF